ncbi:hypothetical protein IAG41_12425 [Sphingomonas sp. JC676]|uniref:hypothetical protein n=1 Tax=Sphingomonas sp. JC676 TaxID=2768065 RepID=UPI001657ED38|nr:hypothetical protein [Sphingomonas sp. JC676]MBC9033196.1 hypothetical protein [Sphingomonas sp. JC676]
MSILAIPPSAISAYKHVPAKFGDAFASGESIQLATLNAYREMEGDRADQLEGVVRYSAQRIWAGMPGGVFNPAQVFLSRRMEAMMGSGHSFEGCSFQFRVQPFYVFCASSQPDLRRADMGEHIFFIENLREFAWQIKLASGGLLGNYDCQPVRYCRRSSDVDRSGEVLPEGPFYKNIDKKWENEVRAAWEVDDESKPYIRLSVPQVSKLIKRIS